MKTMTWMIWGRMATRRGSDNDDEEDESDENASLR